MSFWDLGSKVYAVRIGNVLVQVDSGSHLKKANVRQLPLPSSFAEEVPLTKPS